MFNIIIYILVNELQIKETNLESSAVELKENMKRIKETELLANDFLKKLNLKTIEVNYWKQKYEKEHKDCCVSQ